jgi:hypothetical protein
MVLHPCCYAILCVWMRRPCDESDEHAATSSSNSQLRDAICGCHQTAYPVWAHEAAPSAGCSMFSWRPHSAGAVCWTPLPPCCQPEHMMLHRPASAGRTLPCTARSSCPIQIRTADNATSRAAHCSSTSGAAFTATDGAATVSGAASSWSEASPLYAPMMSMLVPPLNATWRRPLLNKFNRLTS